MPFKPKYKNTNKISNNLGKIASAREVIEQACLSPGLERWLRRRALLISAHASTALSGNRLSLGQVECLYKKKSGRNGRKSVQTRKLYGIL
jgi:hypothetical protein